MKIHRESKKLKKLIRTPPKETEHTKWITSRHMVVACGPRSQRTTPVTVSILTGRITKFLCMHNFVLRVLPLSVSHIPKSHQDFPR